MLDSALPTDLLTRFVTVRRRSMMLAAPLGVEDQCIQSMLDASPTKWHLAHTTWFFESQVLCQYLPEYQAVDLRFNRLFGVDRETAVALQARMHRGMLTRPTLPEVLSYRMSIDQTMVECLSDLQQSPASRALIELGLQHEQQHQELMLTDILHAMFLNPSRPSVLEGSAPKLSAPPPGVLEYGGGTVQIGHIGPGFAFDNEHPCHAVQLAPYAISRRLVTNAEYQVFIDANGYSNPRWWRPDGWAAVQAQGWRAPLYWLADGQEFTLNGVQARAPEQAVRHLSLYEAQAYADWAGVRLPTEIEWEAAVNSSTPPDQMFGVAWQWTTSPCAPYPGHRPPSRTVAEYDGKFMLGQQVLRGSSSATPPGHARATYRRFLAPTARWQFTGLRLARDL